MVILIVENSQNLGAKMAHALACLIDNVLLTTYEKLLIVDVPVSIKLITEQLSTTLRVFLRLKKVIRRVCVHDYG